MHFTKILGHYAMKIIWYRQPIKPDCSKSLKKSVFYLYSLHVLTWFKTQLYHNNVLIHNNNLNSNNNSNNTNNNK